MIKSYNDELKEIWNSTHKKEVKCLICFNLFEEGEEYSSHKKVCAGRDLHNRLVSKWFEA